MNPFSAYGGVGAVNLNELAKVIVAAKALTSTEYVIRRSDSPAYVKTVFPDSLFSYSEQLDDARRFTTANAAADAIRRRMAGAHEILRSRTFVIVPVTVTHTPAKYETKRIEVSPATTTVTL